MFCAKCGGAIPDGGGFCVKCGTPARPLTTPDGRLKRPGAITLLAILDFIGGGLWLVICLFALVGLSMGSPADREPAVIGIFALLALFAIVQIVCGIGMWKLKRYGRVLQIISACIGLLGIPIGTIISIVILVYLNKPGVKLLFSETPVTSMTPEEQALVAATSSSSSTATVIIAAVSVLILLFVVGIVAAIAVPGLLRARMSGNEAVAIGHLRAFTTAETSYALGNRLLYDRPDCLMRPAECVAGYSGPAFLSEHPEQKSGFRFTFYPGAPPAPLPAGASASSMTSFVITAAPISQSTGSRQFCADHSGDIRAAPLSAETVTAGPACPPNWSVVH
jgi:hypothetical protein